MGPVHNFKLSFFSGKMKPFRYTEIQKHTFHLKSKDDIKDRQVSAASFPPAWPGARHAPGLLQQTGQADQVQPQKVH